MKKYVKPKTIYLYDFLMFTTIETEVVVCSDREELFSGQSGMIVADNNVGGYIVDSISSSKSGTIYLEVHKKWKENTKITSQ